MQIKTGSWTQIPVSLMKPFKRHRVGTHGILISQILESWYPRQPANLLARKKLVGSTAEGFNFQGFGKLQCPACLRYAPARQVIVNFKTLESWSPPQPANLLARKIICCLPPEGFNFNLQGLNTKLRSPKLYFFLFCREWSNNVR